MRRSRKAEEWTVWSLDSPPEGKHMFDLEMLWFGQATSRVSVVLI